MKNFSFLQRMFLLLFVGISMFAVQSCNEEIDKPSIENNDSEKKEPLTLFKLWYLTDFSSSSSLDWQNDEVVSWGENMKFSTNALYWNSRSGGENTTYKLSTQGGGTGSIGVSFSAVNTNNTDDQRIITVKNMTEKYLLLYDSQEELYRAFVSATFAKFSNNGDNGGSGDNDDEEEGDDEEDEEEESEPKECGMCHGSGECPGHRCDGGTCSKCDGKGYTYYTGYGGNQYKEDCECSNGKCSVCRGSGECKYCGGDGYL